MIHQRHQPGFTLIEVLATTILAALLACVMLQVVSGLMRDTAAHAAAPDAAPPVDLLDLLHRDLRQAGTVVMKGPRLVMDTHASLDPVTGEPLQRPATVTWYIQQAGGASWLIREQVLLDDVSDNRLSRRLIARGTGTIHAEVDRELTEVAVKLTFTDPSRQPLQRKLLLP